MRRIVLVAVLAVLAAIAVGLAAGCQPAADEAAHTEFDDAIHGVEDAVAGFYVLGTTASAGQIASEMNKLASAWDGVVQTAAGLDDVDLSAATAAFDELETAVDELAPDDPGPMVTVMPLVQALEAEVEKVHEAGGFH
jgi:hypothetical protein